MNVYNKFYCDYIADPKQLFLGGKDMPVSVKPINSKRAMIID